MSAFPVASGEGTLLPTVAFRVLWIAVVVFPAALVALAVGTQARGVIAIV